jgi:surface protein
MFYGATTFNQNISSWNVANVADMPYMFYGATAFNQNIGSWNVSGVKNMYGMFESAGSFNQSLCAWNEKVVIADVQVGSMFQSSGCVEKSDPTSNNWCQRCESS